MARNFDGITDYLTLADNASLTLPDGDWTIAGQMRLTDMSGTSHHYFLSHGAFDATPSINWYVQSGSKYLTVNFKDDDGTSAPITDTAIDTVAWRHVLLQRDADTIRQFVDGVARGTCSATNFNSCDVGEPLYLGTRSNLPGTRYFQGDLAEWAKWNVALSSDEIARLVAGVRPVDIGRRPAWYLPMCGGLHEEINAVAVNNFGAVASEHPPRAVYASAPRVLRAISSFIAGPYQVLAAETGGCGTTAAGVFSTGITRGQVNEQ